MKALCAGAEECPVDHGDDLLNERVARRDRRVECREGHDPQLVYHVPAAEREETPDDRGVLVQLACACQDERRECEHRPGVVDAFKEERPKVSDAVQRGRRDEHDWVVECVLCQMTRTPISFSIRGMEGQTRQVVCTTLRTESAAAPLTQAPKRPV